MKRASLVIFESVSQERDFVRQEAQHLRDHYDRSEQAALFPTEDVEDLIFQLSEARKTGKYFHDFM